MTESTQLQPFKTVDEVLDAIAAIGVEVDRTIRPDAALAHHIETGHCSFNLDHPDWDGCLTFTVPCELWPNGGVGCWVQCSLNAEKYGLDPKGIQWYLNLSSENVDFPFSDPPAEYPDFTEIQQILGRIGDQLLPELQKKIELL